MRFKSLYLAAGASALMASSAFAGELQLTVRNVNNLDAGGNTSAANVEMDTDEIAVPTFPDSNQVTVESAIVLSESRDFSGAKFMPAHIEVNLDDRVSTLNIVPGNANQVVRIDLSGSANPTFKQSFSPAEIVRAGGDNVSSQGAFGALTNAGATTSTFVLDAAEPGETDVGFVLPVAINDCGNVVVTITLSDPALPGVTRSASTTVATCGNDAVFIANFVTPKDLKVDYDLDAPFEYFLVPDGFSGKGFATSAYADFGLIDFKVKNALFTVKAKSNNPGVRFIDAREIASYSITFSFVDSTGIDGISLYAQEDNDCPEGNFGFTPGTNDIEVELTGSQVISCFGLDGTDEDEEIGLGGVQKGTVLLYIHSELDGPIATQDIDVSSHVIDLVMSPSPLPAGETSSNAMLRESATVIETNTQDDAFRIVRDGLNFGPFDWATAPGLPVQSFFRVSGLPKLEERDQHGNVVRGTVEGLTRYAGSLFLNHSSKGVEGACEFDLTDQIVAGHGELIITPQLVADILQGDFGPCAGSAFLDNFQRADFTFTWFIPTEEALETDMDRLLATGSVFADYGDNGNDAFSLKARSCDSGRFGPHVANNLSGLAADVLTFLCGLGDSENVRRR